jgi:hypothetical protein
VLSRRSSERLGFDVSGNSELFTAWAPVAGTSTIAEADFHVDIRWSRLRGRDVHEQTQQSGSCDARLRPTP